MAAILPARWARAVFQLCASVLVALCVMPSARAQAVVPIVLDWHFGDGGLGEIPPVQTNANVVSALGFVHMRAGLGYVTVSVQNVNGARRLVATRFTDEGVVYAPWGNGGSVVYSLPVPDDAMLAVNVEGVLDFIYLAYVFQDAGNINKLLVARLDSGNGALVGLGISALPVAFPGVGPGWVTAMAPACAGACLASGRPGVVLAVQGQGAARTTTDLVQVGAGTNGDGTPTLAISEHRFNSLVDVAGLSVNQLLPRADNGFEAVGSAQGKALYLRYDAHSDQLDTLQTFDLPCGNTASTASAADSLVREASLGAEGALLLGRAACGGVNSAVLARLPNLAAASPSLSWSLLIGGVVDGYGCGDLSELCFTAYAGLSAPGHAYAVAPAGYLARVDFSDNAGRVAGRDSLLVDNGSLAVLPGQHLGAHADSPWLTGLGAVSAGGTFAVGLSRIAVDRVFADGMERP